MTVIIPYDDVENGVCVSFGRAPYFLAYDTETGCRSQSPNPAAQEQGGAGLKAAQCVADLGARALITFRCGENAAEVLAAAGVEIYKAPEADVDRCLQAFAEGKLEKLTKFHAGFHGIR